MEERRDHLHVAERSACTRSAGKIRRTGARAGPGGAPEAARGRISRHAAGARQRRQHHAAGLQDAPALGDDRRLPMTGRLRQDDAVDESPGIP
jgi:hypothetical protein